MSKLQEDSYDLWRENEVTQLFFAHMLELHDEWEKMALISASVEKTGMLAIERDARVDTLKNLIKWKPEVSE